MEHFKDLFQKAADSIEFLLIFFVVFVGIFLLAYIAEKLIQKKNGVKEKVFTTRKIAMVGMFSAIAGLLMFFEFPLLAIAPGFYQLDFSELPVLICGYAFGPVAGVMAEFLKIVIKLLLKNTSTMFIGDFANFVVGCTMILPATVVYHLKKSKKMALVSCGTGTLTMTLFGTAFNAIYLVPAFATFFNWPLEDIIEEGAKINSLIGDSLINFVIICVAPFNVIKGVLISLLTILIYKPLSPFIKGNYRSYR